LEEVEKERVHAVAIPNDRSRSLKLNCLSRSDRASLSCDT